MQHKSPKNENTNVCRDMRIYTLYSCTLPGILQLGIYKVEFIKLIESRISEKFWRFYALF